MVLVPYCQNTYKRFNVSSEGPLSESSHFSLTKDFCSKWQYTKHFWTHISTHTPTQHWQQCTLHYSTVHFHNNTVYLTCTCTVDGNFYRPQGYCNSSLLMVLSTCTVQCTCTCSLTLSSLVIYSILFSWVLLHVIVTQCGIKHAYSFMDYSDVFT